MAVGPLEALHGAGHDIALVVTNPPRRRSRRGAPVPTPVGERAAELGLEVSHDLADTTGVGAELGVVVAFVDVVSVVVVALDPGFVIAAAANGAHHTTSSSLTRSSSPSTTCNW